VSPSDGPANRSGSAGFIVVYPYPWPHPERAILKNRRRLRRDWRP